MLMNFKLKFNGHDFTTLHLETYSVRALKQTLQEAKDMLKNNRVNGRIADHLANDLGDIIDEKTIKFQKLTTFDMNTYYVCKSLLLNAFQVISDAVDELEFGLSSGRNSGMMAHRLKAILTEIERHYN